MVLYGTLAQSVEQLAVNQWVVGSSPTRPAKACLSTLYESGLRPRTNRLKKRVEFDNFGKHKLSGG